MRRALSSWLMVVSLFVTSGCRSAAPRPETSQSAPHAEAGKSVQAHEATPTVPGLRLPKEVWPTQGALDLTLLPDQPDYEGTARYELQVKAPASVIWLNATGLTLDAPHVRAGDRELPARVIPGNDDVVGIALGEPLAPGTASLSVHFRAQLDRNRSRGIYAASEGGAWYAYTFFEPVDARRAFPCFDEPSAKIPWTLRLRVHPQDGAFANAKAVGERTEGGLKVVDFAPSKPIPSYLVAFVVGPFDVVEAGTAGHHGTPLRFIVPRGRGAETAFARSVTPKLVERLEDFFGMPYPFGKLDVAVVPRYWGTMEHPGLVALGQPLTLIKPEEDSPDRRQSYVGTAGHELAHYWFGDYVTCAFWDDTWLNESLASWLDPKISDAIDPTFKAELRAKAYAVRPMQADALPGAKRLSEPIRVREDIESSFDNDISYFKGAAVVAMLERTAGPERFRDAIRGYLAAHAWGNATSEDFVAALRTHLSPELAHSFETFLTQTGFPRVSYEVDCASAGGPKLRLSQEPYAPLGLTPPAGRLWTVPVCWAARGEGAPERACTLLSGPTTEVKLNRCPRSVSLKDGGAGYYVAAYPSSAVKASDFAKGSPMPLPDQLAKLGDISQEIHHGTLSRADALGLAPTLAASPERLLLNAAVGVVNDVPEEALTPDLRPRFQAFVRRLFRPRLKALGTTAGPRDTEEDRRMRASLLHVLGERGEDPIVLSEARARASRWLTDHKGLDPNLVDLTLGLAAQQGDQKLLEQMLKALHTATETTERDRLLSALGSFPPPLLDRALALAADPHSDAREALPLLSSALHSQSGRDVAFRFVLAHFDTLGPRMRDDDMGSLIHYSIGQSCDARRAEETDAFFKERVKKRDGGPRTLEKAVEGMRACAARLPGESAALQTFLAHEKAAGPKS